MRELRGRLGRVIGIPSAVLEKLRRHDWGDGDHMTVILDVASEKISLETAMARLAELNDFQETSSEAVSELLLKRLEDLERAALVDQDRADLWRALGVSLLQYDLTLLTRWRKTHVGFSDKEADAGITGVSDAVRELRTQIVRCAAGDGNIIITGETGVGKERVARAIHRLSHRSDAPFIAINCAAISPGLIESELFGHRRGSFTGAFRDHEGVFRAAEGGVLFLDEIGEMPLEIQAKLLRCLESRMVRPVGDVRERPVNVRVLSATNRDVQEAIEEKKLRRDLYYRLRVHSIETPPLRRRVEDIPLLIAHFIGELNEKRTRVSRLMTDKERAVFMAYPWPGNVRQLRSCVEEWADRDGDAKSSLPLDIQDWVKSHSPALTFAIGRTGEKEELDGLEAHILRYTQKVLASVDGNRVRTADVLGISRSRLYRILSAPGAAEITKPRRGRPKKIAS